MKNIVSIHIKNSQAQVDKESYKRVNYSCLEQALMHYDVISYLRNNGYTWESISKLEKMSPTSLSNSFNIAKELMK